jgi:hypothetical protein
MAGEPPYRILVEDGGQIQGVAQTLIRRGAFGRQIAYVPHGPVWDRSAANADRIFAWLAQGLRSLALKEKALVVKMDPRNEPGQDFDFSHLAAEHDLQPAQDLQAPTTRIVDLLDVHAEHAGNQRQQSRDRLRDPQRLPRSVMRDPDAREHRAGRVETPPGPCCPREQRGLRRSRPTAVRRGLHTAR